MEPRGKSPEKEGEEEPEEKEEIDEKIAGGRTHNEMPVSIPLSRRRISADDTLCTLRNLAVPNFAILPGPLSEADPLSNSVLCLEPLTKSVKQYRDRLYLYTQGEGGAYASQDD
ncbi:hypothetical protein KC342_g18960 [Hortaea werneckii]|nr:hypothetical protein KC342_g18960 [Hortaea werneckii]KAI7400739.1 hypothetical protein KC328_g3434 [Hortaea werneckii]